MDLEAEAERLGLDVLAGELGARLDAAAVPYVLLKGPSTAMWLYQPPRRYRDVDLLISPDRLTDALAALAQGGLAVPAAGRLGEEAHHAMLLRSASGFEVDLHVTLPALPLDGTRVLTLLRAHVVTMDLGPATVRVLDEPARCVVLALHALGSGSDIGQAADDLRRARSKAGEASWARAGELAATLGGRDLFDAGLALVEPGRDHAASRRALLYLDHAPAAALGLQRLAEARRRDLPKLLARELLPSRGFMSYAEQRDLHGGDLAVAHWRRWHRLARSLPAGCRAWWAARG